MIKKFAIPTENGKLCAHFGHCERFAIIETDDNSIINEQYITPPAHEPGSYPRYLADLGVDVIISGGMGIKAQDLFTQNKIQVCVGANSDLPRKLVEQYLKNELVTGQNMCDH